MKATVKVDTSKLAVKPKGQLGEKVYIAAGETIDLEVGLVVNPQASGTKEKKHPLLKVAIVDDVTEFLNAPVMGSASGFFDPVEPSRFTVMVTDGPVICREYGLNPDSPSSYADFQLETGQHRSFTTTELNAVTVELLPGLVATPK